MIYKEGWHAHFSNWNWNNWNNGTTGMLSLKKPCNSWLTVSEVILSTFAGDLAVVDGVDGTMVIAAETTCAAVIIFPFGCFVKLYVADGTHLRTFATVDADVGIDGKFLVGDHEAVEICSDDVAEGPWSES